MKIILTKILTLPLQPLAQTLMLPTRHISYHLYFSLFPSITSYLLLKFSFTSCRPILLGLSISNYISVHNSILDPISAHLSTWPIHLNLDDVFMYSVFLQISSLTTLFIYFLIVSTSPYLFILSILLGHVAQNCRHK